ncbi:MAG TPA: DUF2278 family protein [Chloroflexia bacterium]|nr:DUF2278 family protein [Chloroflexia bacterium]
MRHKHRNRHFLQRRYSAPKGRYYLLKCRVLEGKYGHDTNDHYQIRVTDNNQEYRITINTKSNLGKPDLRFLVVDNFVHPVTELLENNGEGVEWGFTGIANLPGGLALDYIRGNLFDYNQMRVVPQDAPLPANSLYHQIDNYIQLAIHQRGAVLYAYGKKWQDSPHHPGPQYFDQPILAGLHDIHMNQGDDHPAYRSQNGVWQDGGLIFHFAAENRWVALFFAFQSQSFHTDDRHGNCLQKVPRAVPVPKWKDSEAAEPDLVIVAALVNPIGPDPGHETVTLLNLSNKEVNLDGWKLADKNKRVESLPDLTVEPGKTARITLSGDGARFSNEGGLITLLNPEGYKIDGVAYTRAQAKFQGRTITFR